MRQTIDVKCRVGGFFKLVATDADGGERVLADWFPNLITNGGLDQIGTTATWLTGCSVGSGNTAPSDTDTHLVTLVASSTDIIGTISSVLATSPYYGSRINTYFFAAGVAAGTLAEVGVGLSPSALFSRALILDGNGNPTTVVVGVGEALTVFYEFRNYPPLTDTTGSVTISGVSYNYTVRAANCGAGNWAPSELGDVDGPLAVTAYQAGIAALTSAPSGTSAPEDSGADVAYTPASLHIDRNSVFGGATANFSGGIGSLLYACGQTNGAMGEFQVGFNVALPKTNSSSLALTVRKSWARGPV
jgi:hypothetical protein